ncbi:hypothetical protein HBI67_064920 [Parastagonospora nodorum]|nr:hypothetical protein HBI79_048210 [Parastagonospora nodorum]KAH6074286.1 hypothetical protein HBI67_064920 [Parastagonospora nodorum]KAH6088139.1 hypothetical protein HBI66_032450 [Parastagonospora nodorum]
MPFTTTVEGPARPSPPTSKPKTTTDSPTPETKPVYFFRPTQGNGYLSQWYWSPFTTPTSPHLYATAEMYMMVQKALLFSDPTTASAMLETTDPARHKALGRQVANFDEKIWDANKERIVEEANWWKFTRTEDAEELCRMLLETGEREIVEASLFDRVWGVGFKEGVAGRNRQRWGRNLLGRALERVRRRLREEGGKKEGE